MNPIVFSSFKIEDKDIYLLLTYKFTPKEVSLDKDKIMGLDLQLKNEQLARTEAKLSSYYLGIQTKRARNI
jgi:hypothetical protein